MKIVYFWLKEFLQKITYADLEINKSTPYYSDKHLTEECATKIIQTNLKIGGICGKNQQIEVEKIKVCF